jgi:hypothetical protein
MNEDGDDTRAKAKAKTVVTNHHAGSEDRTDLIDTCGVYET